MRRLRWMFWVMIAAASSPAAVASVELISALPSLGRATDIRDTSAVRTATGTWNAYQSYSYRFADQKFDATQRTVGLGFNQTVTLAAAPLSIAYGVNERLVLGLTIPVETRVRRSLSLTNYSPGTTLFGRPLPVGQSVRFVQQGDGPGDLTLNSQFRFSRTGARVTAAASLDLTVPTAPSDPRDALDLPVGQGYWGVTPSVSFSTEDGCWTHFAKAGFEFAAGMVARDAAGVRSVVEPGTGGNFTLGSAFRMHRGVTARLNLSGFERLGREVDGARQPEGSVRSVELRPGLSLHRGKVRWDADTFLPVAGLNVLRTTGLFLTAGVTF